MGLDARSALPVLRLYLDSAQACTSHARFIQAAQEVARDLACSATSKAAPRFGQTAMAVDLEVFADFLSWQRVTSKITDGNSRRAAATARKHGCTSRIVGEKSFDASLHALTGSKVRRSKGLFVVAALSGPRTDLVDTRIAPERPVCPLHWRIAWGAFRTIDGAEKLVCYAKLVRAGDAVFVQSLIGHGDALRDGITKMLMFDIMAWLLDRRDPCVIGLRALIHGSMEEGAEGLFLWKRRLGFRPVLLHLADHQAETGIKI